MSDVGPPQLFFVLDNGGRLVSSPFGDCTSRLGLEDSEAVIDGKRVAIGLVCNGGPAVVTCVLPSAKVDVVALPPFAGFGAPRVALSGNIAVFAQASGFAAVQSTTVMMMDLAAGSPPTPIRVTSNGIGQASRSRATGSHGTRRATRAVCRCPSCTCTTAEPG